MRATIFKRQSNDPGFNEGDAYFVKANLFHDAFTLVDVDFIKLERRELRR